MTSLTGTPVTKAHVIGDRYSVIDVKPLLITDNRLPITAVSPRSGFTLVEVCLVCLVVSLILTISWPVLNHTARKNQLETLCNEISYTLRYTRDYALNENKYYSVQFDTTNNKYFISVKDDLSTDPNGFARINDSLHKTRSWPKEISLDNISSTQVVFYPDGSSDDFVISFKNTQGNIYKLKLQGSTGRTSVTTTS
jgi:Tfp pilus assembly protein FimT